MNKFKYLTIAFLAFFTCAIADAGAIYVDGIGYDGSNVASEQKEGVWYLTLTGYADEDLIIRDGEKVVLDLAGNKMTNYTLATEAIKIEKGGELTIKDSSGNNSGVVTHLAGSTYGPITNLGKLIIESGTFTTDQNFYVIRNEADMTIKGGVFTSDTNTSLIGNIQYVDNTVTPNLVIENGTFTATSNAVKNNENSVITINGGTFTSEKAFALDNSAKATINGGTFTSTQNSAIRQQIDSENPDATSLTIKNATLNSAEGKADYTIYDMAIDKDVTADYNVTTDENGNLITTKDDDEVIVTPSTDKESAEEVTNPKTSDNIVIYVIAMISAVLIAIVSIKRLRKNA